MNDIDRARMKRMSQPGPDGMLYFMQYMWPLVHPGERLERTPVVEAIAEVASRPVTSSPLDRRCRLACCRERGDEH